MNIYQIPQIIWIVLKNDRTIIPEKIKNELALLDIKYLEMIQNKMNIEKMRIQNTLDYERQIIEKIYSERKEFREINYEKIKSYDRIMNSPNIDLKQTRKTIHLHLTFHTG